MAQPLCKTVRQFCKQLNTELLHDPEILLLDISQKLKMYVLTKTCTRMFPAPVLITAKKWT